MSVQPARQFCTKCLLTLGMICLITIASFIYLSLNPAALFTLDAMRGVATYVHRFFPPDHSPEFLAKIFNGVFETLAVSALATLIAAIASLFLALPAAGKFGRPAQVITRFFLNFLRSVPELVWATLMVLAVGLGPFAGTLALTLHTTGVLGRLFGESLENFPPQTNDALILLGSSRIGALLYGVLPGISTQLLSYSLYRWEMNIRMAAILGFVGAGGLGQMLYYELSLLHEPQAASVVLAMLLLVILVDMLSGKMRRVPTNGQG